MFKITLTTETFIIPLSNLGNMKYSNDVGFAIIKRDIEIEEDLIGILNYCFDKNNKNFKKIPFRFDIIICDNLNDFEKRLGENYRDDISGMTFTSKKIIVKSFAISKTTKSRKDYYKEFFLHEFNHIFWYFNYKTFKPAWLREGLACNISNSFILDKKDLLKLTDDYHIKNYLLDYRGLKKNVKEGHYPAYPVWANFTQYIIDKFSISKLMNFLDEYSKKPYRDYYDRLFLIHFGKSDENLFDEWVTSIKSKTLTDNY